MNSSRPSFSSRLGCAIWAGSDAKTDKLTEIELRGLKTEGSVAPFAGICHAAGHALGFCNPKMIRVLSGTCFCTSWLTSAMLTRIFPINSGKAKVKAVPASNPTKSAIKESNVQSLARVGGVGICLPGVRIPLERRSDTSFSRPSLEAAADFIAFVGSGVGMWGGAIFVVTGVRSATTVADAAVGPSRSWHPVMGPSIFARSSVRSE